MGVPEGAIIIIGCFCSYVLAQGIKNLIDLINGKFSFKEIFDNGGMPSSHTATVSALVFGIFFAQGVTTGLAIAAVLAAVVVADALGIRRNIGKIALTVNRFHHSKHSITQGHTFPQVIVGGILGAVVSILTWLIF